MAGKKKYRGPQGFMQVTFGQDSEIAFVDDNGAYPSTLLYPDVVKGKSNGTHNWEVGTDGRQAEMRSDPVYCREWMQDCIWHAMYELSHKARVNGLRLECKSAVKMLPKRIKEGGEKCIESGCNPDFDWQSIPNVTRCVFSKAPWCFSGVHQHMTLYKPSYAWTDWAGMIHILDTLVGVPMEAICFDESSKERRKFYGRAGCHRPTEYKKEQKGVEYRVLGGWVLQSPALMSLAFGLFKIAHNLIYYKDTFDKAKALVDRDLVENIINNCDRNSAVDVVKGIILPYLAEVMSGEKLGWEEWTEERRYVWTDNPLGNGTKGLKMYKMALDGADFFSGKSVEENWGTRKQYISHGGTAKGWLMTAQKLV